MRAAVALTLLRPLTAAAAGPRLFNRGPTRPGGVVRSGFESKRIDMCEVACVPGQQPCLIQSQCADSACTVGCNVLNFEMLCCATIAGGGTVMIENCFNNQYTQRVYATNDCSGGYTTNSDTTGQCFLGTTGYAQNDCSEVVTPQPPALPTPAPGTSAPETSVPETGTPSTPAPDTPLPLSPVPGTPAPATPRPTPPPGQDPPAGQSNVMSVSAQQQVVGPTITAASMATGAAGGASAGPTCAIEASKIMLLTGGCTQYAKWKSVSFVDWELGSDWSRKEWGYYAGAIVFNLLLLGGALVLHWGVVVAFSRKKGIPFAEAAGKLMFPGVLVGLLAAVMQGTTAAGVSLLFYADEAGLKIAGLVGILAILGSLYVCYVCLLPIRARARMVVAWEGTHDRDWRWWLLGEKMWLNRGSGTYVQCLGSAFAKWQNDWWYAGFIEFAQALLIGAMVGAIPADTTAGCHARFILLAIILAAFFTFIVVYGREMFRQPYVWVCQMFLLAMQTVASILTAIAGDFGDDNEDSLRLATDILSAANLFVIVQTALMVFVMAYMMKYHANHEDLMKEKHVDALRSPRSGATSAAGYGHPLGRGWGKFKDTLSSSRAKFSAAVWDRHASDMNERAELAEKRGTESYGAGGATAAQEPPLSEPRSPPISVPADDKSDTLKP